MVLSIQPFFLVVLAMNVVLLRAEEIRNIVPGAYIVEFSSSFTRIQTNNHHQLFYERIAKRNTAVIPVLNYTSPLFIGASFRLNNPDDISAIKALDEVSAVWPVTVYSRPVPIVESIIDLSKLAEEAVSEAARDQFPPHVMTGVDKLHAEGYTGANVSIAVIDSGVDYSHPALGGGFGPGYKIQFGYDLVGDDYTGLNLPVPDSDPMDCGGHGTHVTGIIGAESSLFAGVAPNATLGMYKVFGCGGSSGNDVLIAAFTAAYDAGADIITASLGAASGWTEDPLAVVMSRIATNGVICIASAGNSGAQGLFFTSTPALGADVIAIGSVNSIDTPLSARQGQFAVDSESNLTFPYLPANNPFPADISGYPLYALDFNTSNPADACTELPANTTDLSGKIVLIRRGTCPFVTKITNVQQFGAEYVIFYNNESPIVSPQSSGEVLAAMVSAELGAQWIMYLEEGQTVNFYFPDSSTIDIIYSANNINGGTMSTFSSWSPTNELYIKPEISAPGGNILSTYPVDLGSYAVFSGTSMATPYIAGIIALYKSAKGFQVNINYQTVRQILSTTATPLPFNNGSQTYPYLAPIVQQGGGLVNAYAVVHYTTMISPSTLALNDTANFNETVEFIVSNTDSTAVSYTLTHQGAATAYALGVNTTFPQNFPPDLNTQYATVIISPSNLTIPGQSSVVISVTFASPAMLETQRIPVFSGYISIASSNNESFYLPYAGVACNMKQVMVTDFERRSPYISNSSDFSLIPSPIGTNATFNMIANQPNFNLRLVMGSSVVRLDVLGDGNQTDVLGVDILGSVPDFPVYYISRNFLTSDVNRYTAVWDGTLSSGVQLSAGNYRLLYRALKIFGDPNNNSDYESWLSPLFGIQYGAPIDISSTTTAVITTTTITATTTTMTTPTTTTTTTTTTTVITPTTTTTTTTTTTMMPTTNRAQTAVTYSGQLCSFLIIMCFFHI